MLYEQHLRHSMLIAKPLRRGTKFHCLCTQDHAQCYTRTDTTVPLHWATLNVILVLILLQKLRSEW